jgi:hypothetical protein
MIVPTEVPLGVAILIILPYFVLTIAVIIYTYKIEKSRIITNENRNSKSNNNSRGKDIIDQLFHMKHSRAGSYIGRHNRE